MSLQATECRDLFEIAKTAKISKEKEISNGSKEIKTLHTQKIQLDKAAEVAVCDVRKLQAKLEKWESDAKLAKKEMTSMLKEYPWIQTEKVYFGRKESDFDFESKNIDECKEELKSLKVQQDKLKKKLNTKVLGMLQTAEEEFNDLNKKRQVFIYILYYLLNYYFTTLNIPFLI